MLYTVEEHACFPCIMQAYDIDDPYHTRWIDLPGIVKMVYIVSTCIHAIIAN